MLVLMDLKLDSKLTLGVDPVGTWDLEVQWTQPLALENPPEPSAYLGPHSVLGPNKTMAKFTHLQRLL